jgi:RES domain-containing protein
MPEAWRIVKTKHLHSAFSGEGAAKTGGRWNSHGTRIVYSSGSIALAALETLVHLNPPLVLSWKLIPIHFRDDLIKHLGHSDIPSDWRSEPAPASARQLGDEWARSLDSCVLAVPSVLIPEELNFLINPMHSDFHEIAIGKPKDFMFDPRLLS